MNFVYKQKELYRNERAEERAVHEAEHAEKAAEAEHAAAERAAEAEHVERVAEAEREIEHEVRCVLQIHWRGKETKRESMKFVC